MEDAQQWRKEKKVIEGKEIGIKRTNESWLKKTSDWEIGKKGFYPLNT